MVWRQVKSVKKLNCFVTFSFSSFGSMALELQLSCGIGNEIFNGEFNEMSKEAREVEIEHQFRVFFKQLCRVHRIKSKCQKIKTKYQKKFFRIHLSSEQILPNSKS